MQPFETVKRKKRHRKTEARDFKNDISSALAAQLFDAVFDGFNLGGVSFLNIVH